MAKSKMILDIIYNTRVLSTFSSFDYIICNNERKISL